MNPDSAQPTKKPLSLPSKGRIVGVDFGTVRIGLAITDLNQMIASPLSVYQRRNETLDAKFFKELVTLEQVCGFVVGLPIHLSGERSAKSDEATRFGQWLVECTGLAVTWFDERFTTAFAREVLNESNLSGKKRKERLDKLAAQNLLSAYLEARSSEA